MRISDLIKMGLRNLGRRKARTALTVVGIVIGTISIVVMFSIGIGMNKSFQESVMQLGSMTMITVENYSYDYNNDKANGPTTQKLTDELVEQIRQIPHVKNVSPVIDVQVTLRNGRYQTNNSISAMDYSVFKDFGLPELKTGDYTPSKSKKRIKIWSGPNLFQDFYDPESISWSTKEVDPEKDRVTMELAQDETTPIDSNTGLPSIEFKTYDTDIAIFDVDEYSEYSYSAYMDIGDFKELYKDYMKGLTGDYKAKAKKKLKEYSSIKVNCDNVKDVEGVQDAIKQLGYSSTSLSSMTKPMQQTSNMMQTVLGGVGAVSMIVAAISIANTMIMSIYERIKEIGIMKVLGCQVADIKKLFLFESGIMGLMGGIIGVILSYIASFAINKFGGSLMQALNNSMTYGSEATKLSVIPWYLPILASAFAVAVGVISGYYPASKATKISAIEAMKSE